uniref:UMOD/GP2/OIT3-like D8C domain-containing protein n=1 Tax=Leptobrachium leishanense TaxID=445787 RepID=A0A8C5M0V2_9ANUR
MCVWDNAKSCSDCSGTNAVCAQKNNYVVCSCKSGMIGNGLTCTKAVSCNKYPCCPRGYFWVNGKKGCVDIDECNITTQNKCSPSSTCLNKKGVYLCTNISKALCPSLACPDDKDCMTINGNSTAQCDDPCSNYEELNGDSRWFTNDSTGRFLTDRYNVGWYRYTGSIAVSMKEGCVGALKCGSLEPYSLGGPHPNTTEGVKMVPLLINGLNGCSAGSSIPIKACPGGFYVYKFTGMLKFDVYCTGECEFSHIPQRGDEGPIPVGTHNLGGLGLETGGEDCKVRVIDGCVSELGGRLP